MKSIQLLCLASFFLGIMGTNADIVLYSSSFGGSSTTNLNGQAVVTSGANAAQHTQFGTHATATWSAEPKFKADGSVSSASGVSATLAFTPQNGHVYNLTMTTSFVQLATASFHAMGYFRTSGFTGYINSASGSQVWALTRPGDASFDDQVAHYNLSGGAGNRNAIPTTVEDTTAPSTLRITLDTTGGAGNWAASYHVLNEAGGFTQLASIPDLNAVSIGSVGIGTFTADDGSARFQSFELSVASIDLKAPLITMQSPVDNASKVSIATHIVATFDAPIILGRGNIVMRDLVDGSTSRTIPVMDSSQVTLSGKVLTLIPSTPLAAGRHYAVQAAAGTVLNLSNVPFAGILQSDETTWNFRTAVDPLRIMPMGDSITIGYTNADWTGGGFEFGYRSGLYTLLTNAGYGFRFVGNSTEPWTFRDPLTTDPAWPPTVNLVTLGQDGTNGYAGKTASFLNTGISSWLASQDPDIILLKIGTNGLDQPGLQNLVNTITTSKPQCRLIIAQIMPKFNYQQDIVNYNTWIRETLVPAQQALGRKVTVVNQYAPFLTNPAVLTSIDQSLFSNANNHPSNPGYDKMARVWFDAIEALGLGPDSFSNWIGGFDNIGGQADLRDDPDRDGNANGVENFFGTAPNAFSPGIKIGAVDTAQGTFTFSHPQGVLADDLVAAYQWSKDLQTFYSDLASDAGGSTVALNALADTPVLGTTTVTATVTGAPCSKLFLRVRVTEK